LKKATVGYKKIACSFWWHFFSFVLEVEIVTSYMFLFTID